MLQKQPYFVYNLNIVGDSQVVLVVKNLPANAGEESDMGLIPGLFLIRMFLNQSNFLNPTSNMYREFSYSIANILK